MRKAHGQKNADGGYPLPDPRFRVRTGPARPSGPGQQPIRPRGSGRRMQPCAARHLLRNKRNNLSPRPALSLFCGGENCFHLKAVLGGLSLAKAPHFIHNVIIGHGKLS